MSVPADEHTHLAPRQSIDPPELAEVRSLLFGEMSRELQQLRARVAELEEMVFREDNRAGIVGAVLVESVNETSSSSAELGEALTPAVEEAVNYSARTDSTVLAEALYPVMGPAMRRMIANMFKPEAMIGSGKFAVQQVLLIERESGVLLASTAADGDGEDADIVSGMLDAIRLFVNEAFDTPEHDGLQDLRVGDTSVLVEWGPKAVLASVVRGMPSDDYRDQATLVLEAIHRDFGSQFAAFDGQIAAFAPAHSRLTGLYDTSVKQVKAETNRQRLGVALRVLALIAVVVLIIVVIVWLT